MKKSLKNIVRTKDNASIAGVCAALADFFEIKTKTMRTVYVVFSVLTAFLPGFFLYMFLMLLIPKATE